MAFCAVFCIVSGDRAWAQFNPNGWIQTDAWNFLLPLKQPFSCEAGGSSSMLNNWLCPHSIGTENPKDGDVWDDIQFNGCSPSTGYDFGGIFPAPTWFTLESLEQVRGLAPGTLERADLVNYDFLFALGASFPRDSVLGVATTYVRNLTGSALPLEICTASDDSIQLWLNNTRLLNLSACRGDEGRCIETTPATLPPGISKLAVLVWQGQGGWNFRVAFRMNGSLLVPEDGLVEVLGPTTAGYLITRTLTPPSDPCAVSSIAVTVKGTPGPDFQGSGSDSLTVIETITAQCAGDLEITGVTQGGAVSSILPPQPPGFPSLSPVGIFDNHHLMGVDPGGGTSTSFDPASQKYQTYSDTGGGLDNFEFAYVRLQGDFDFSILFEPSLPDGTTGCIGLMARQSLGPCSRYTMVDQILTSVLRVTGRRIHGACAGADFSVNSVISSILPSLRLTRRGNTLTGWYRQDSGGGPDPSDDANWQPIHSETWECSPDSLYVGFAASFDHHPGPQVFKVIRLQGTKLAIGAALHPDAKRITWNTSRNSVTNGLVKYTVAYPALERVNVQGNVDGTKPIRGERFLEFHPPATEGVGGFETSYDVGVPARSGSASFEPGTATYTTVGSGLDIWDIGDEFHFLYRSVAGDFTATARIVDFPDPPRNRWGKVGIMARYTCEGDSKYSMACAPFRGENPQEAFKRRHQSRRDDQTPGTSRDDQVVPDGIFTAPHLGWARLTRKGNYFYSEFAEDQDGQPGPWVLAGGDTHDDAPQALLLGFANCAHGSSGGQLLTVKFDHWSISAAPGEPDQVCAPLSRPSILATFETGLPSGTIVRKAAGIFTPLVIGERLRLSQSGSKPSATGVYFPAPGSLTGETGFHAEFDAYCFVTEQSPLPADGMTFAAFEGGLNDLFPLKPENCCDTLGYGWTDPNLTYTTQVRRKSFAFEIDHWDNGVYRNDPPGHAVNTGSNGDYHVGFDFNQSVQSAQTNVEYGQPVPPFVNDPAGIHVEVRYTPLSQSTARLEAWITHNDGSFPRRQVLSAIGPRLDGEILVGLTAGAGDLSSTQEVDNLTVRRLCCHTPGPIQDCDADGATDQCELASGLYTDTDHNGIPDNCQNDIEVIPVPVTINPATTTDTRTSRPTGAPTATRGSQHWVEIWASDRGENNTGLTGVYVNVAFCGASLPVALSHGNLFTQFASGSLAGNTVQEFGGSALPSGGGVEPEWVRIGWIQARAGSESNGCSIALSPSTTGIAAFRRGEIKKEFTQFGSASVTISAASTSYDLDQSGQVGVGDLSIFAGSWLQQVPPALAAHDFDCDNFVGVGDLSWFATGWLKPAKDPGILYPVCGGGGGGGLGGEAPDVQFRLLALRSASLADVAETLPVSITSVGPADPFVLEVWVSDVGDRNTGLTSAYVDLTFPGTAVRADKVDHTPLFNVFASGALQPDKIDELGGSSLPGGVGVQPQWTRVTVVQMTATGDSTGVFHLTPSTSGVACLARGAIPWSAISLDELSLTTGAGGHGGTFRRGEVNADGTIDLSDAIFLLSWLFTGGQTPGCTDAADANDDASVDISDGIYVLSWLFTGGTEPTDPGPTACGPDPTPDDLPDCDYPAEFCSP